MTHEVHRRYKKHYPVTCGNCHLTFYEAACNVTFGVQFGKPWVTKTKIGCPNCKDQRLGKAHSYWVWIPSRVNRKAVNSHSPFIRTIFCTFGKIAHLKMYAPSRNYLHFSTSVGRQVRGTFFSEDSHFRVNLSEHCSKQENYYVINPFAITVTSNNQIIACMTGVMLAEAKPFVLVKEEENYALLSRSCDFTATLTYLDPIVAYFK